MQLLRHLKHNLASDSYDFDFIVEFSVFAPLARWPAFPKCCECRQVKDQARKGPAKAASHVYEITLPRARQRGSIDPCQFLNTLKCQVTPRRTVTLLVDWPVSVPYSNASRPGLKQTTHRRTCASLQHHRSSFDFPSGCFGGCDTKAAQEAHSHQSA